MGSLWAVWNQGAGAVQGGQGQSPAVLSSLSSSPRRPLPPRGLPSMPLGGALRCIFRVCFPQSSQLSDHLSRVHRTASFSLLVLFGAALLAPWRKPEGRSGQASSRGISLRI